MSLASWKDIGALYLPAQLKGVPWQSAEDTKDYKPLDLLCSFTASIKISRLRSWSQESVWRQKLKVLLKDLKTNLKSTVPFIAHESYSTAIKNQFQGHKRQSEVHNVNSWALEAVS